MEIKDVLELATDEEGRKFLKEFIEDTKREIAPAMEIILPEFDNLINKGIDYTASKVFYAYTAYMEAGFDSEQAFILANNLKVGLSTTYNNLIDRIRNETIN